MIPANLQPCQCPAGPCVHYPFPATGRFLQCRQGASGMPREQELRYLQRFAMDHVAAQPSAVAQRARQMMPPGGCCG